MPARSTAARSRRSPAPARPSATSTSFTSAAAATTRRSGTRLARGSNPTRYTLLDYEPGLADALAATDLVLARSGGSIFEIAAAGRPAILVPYPYASAEHQRANAEWMADAGAAVVIEDAELDAASGCASSPASCSAIAERLGEMAAASRALARPEAAERVAAEVLGRDRQSGDELSGDWGGRELHFIAIGGAGMSGLALVCHRLGAAVTGSDRAESSYLQAAARGRARAARSATTPTRCRPTPRWSSRPRSPRTTPSSSAPASAASASSTAASCSPSSARCGV